MLQPKRISKSGTQDGHKMKSETTTNRLAVRGNAGIGNRDFRKSQREKKKFGKKGRKKGTS